MVEIVVNLIIKLQNSFASGKKNYKVTIFSSLLLYIDKKIKE